MDIKRFLEENDSHILAVSKAELRDDVDLLQVQIDGYELPTMKALQNPTLKVSRLVVYVKANAQYEHMDQLKTEGDATIWLLIKRQRMRPIRVGCIYREQTM